MEKYSNKKNYYTSLKNYDDYKINKFKIKKIKTSSGYITTDNIINEDTRRYKQFKKVLTNNHVLDFGCAWGGFMKKIKKINLYMELKLEKNV